MIKKNQVSLLLLSVILMLTVYYVKTRPGSVEQIENVTTETSEIESMEYVAMRLSVEEERNQMILVFQDIIGDTDAGIEEKSLAIDAMQDLVQVSEQEQLLELEIVNFGYYDAFVHSTDGKVNVQILTEDFSVEEANEIIYMTMLEFGSDLEISVEYDVNDAEVVGD